MPKTVRVRASLALIAITAVTVLAGCGVVTQGSGSSSSGGTSSGPSSDGTKYATAQIEAAMKSPKFEAQGPAFDASKAKGKSIWFIPNTSTIPFVVAVQKAFASVSDKVGTKLTVWPTTGKPTEWVQGIEQAIAQKADVIVLAAPPQLLGPQLAQIKAAGIPVVVPHQYDVSMDKPKDVTAFALAPFIDAAKLMADYAISDTKGKANTLVITTNESPPSKPMADSIRAEYKKYCDDCAITEVNVPAADWGSKMQSEVQTALLRDPTINYIIPIFDSSTQFVVPGIAAAGKTGQVGIATFNNTPFVLTNVQKGTVSMDVGESITWIGYVAMDQVLRLLSGQKALTDASAPLRVFTKANATVLGDPADNEKGYSDAYVKGYLKLWGLEK